MTPYVRKFRESVVVSAQNPSEFEAALNQEKIKFKKTDKGFVFHPEDAQKAKDLAQSKGIALSDREVLFSSYMESDEDDIEQRIEDINSSIELKMAELRLAQNKVDKDKIQQEIYFLKQQAEDLEDSLLEERSKK